MLHFFCDLLGLFDVPGSEGCLFSSPRCIASTLLICLLAARSNFQHEEKGTFSSAKFAVQERRRASVFGKRTENDFRLRRLALYELDVIQVARHDAHLRECVGNTVCITAYKGRDGIVPVRARELAQNLPANVTRRAGSVGPVSATVGPACLS